MPSTNGTGRPSMGALAPVRGLTVKSPPRLECDTISVFPLGATAIPWRKDGPRMEIFCSVRGMSEEW
jgi:hypothetical protein